MGVHPKRVLRDLASARLTHFLLLALPIFLWDISRQPHLQTGVLDISPEELEQRVRRATSGRVPPADERARLEQQVIEDLVLVAEARRLGLDQDDEIVRARLVQKMLFVAEELGGGSQVPSEEVLRAFYHDHRDDFLRPARYRFTHVFARTGEGAQALLPEVRAWAANHQGGLPPFGEAFAGPRTLELDEARLAASYGDGFVAALAKQPLNRWVGPLHSRYGAHLVRIQERLAPAPASYGEVQKDLPLKWLIARRRTAVRRYLTQLLDRYQVRVDGQDFALQAALGRPCPTMQTRAKPVRPCPRAPRPAQVFSIVSQKQSETAALRAPVGQRERPVPARRPAASLSAEMHSLLQWCKAQQANRQGQQPPLPCTPATAIAPICRFCPCDRDSAHASAIAPSSNPK